MVSKLSCLCDFMSHRDISSLPLTIKNEHSGPWIAGDSIVTDSAHSTWETRSRLHRDPEHPLNIGAGDSRAQVGLCVYIRTSLPMSSGPQRLTHGQYDGVTMSWGKGWSP